MPPLPDLPQLPNPKQRGADEVEDEASAEEGQRLLKRTRMWGKQVAPPWRMQQIFGGDFSGLEIAFEAACELAEKVGITMVHGWSSDIDKHCRRCLSVQ